MASEWHLDEMRERTRSLIAAAGEQVCHARELREFSRELRCQASEVREFLKETRLAVLSQHQRRLDCLRIWGACSTSTTKDEP